MQPTLSVCAHIQQSSWISSPKQRMASYRPSLEALQQSGQASDGVRHLSPACSSVYYRLTTSLVEKMVRAFYSTKAVVFTKLSFAVDLNVCSLFSSV